MFQQQYCWSASILLPIEMYFVSRAEAIPISIYETQAERLVHDRKNAI